MSTKVNSSRTVIPRGRYIRSLRQSRSLTLEEFGELTDNVVAQAALRGDSDKRLLRQYRSRKRQDRDAGLSVKTLTKVERGKPVYLFTLKIVALALGVPMAALIDPDDASEPSRTVTVNPASIEGVAEHIVRKAGIGDRISSAELARILREALEMLVPWDPGLLDVPQG